MKKKPIVIRIFAVVFCAVILIFSALGDPVSRIKAYFGYVSDNVKGAAEDGSAPEPYSGDSYSDTFALKDFFVDLNGYVGRALDLKELYRETGIYILDGGYIVSRYNRTEADYEVEEILRLKEFLDGRGIALLYVNAPTKYFDDGIFEKNFGVRSFCNDNADRFLAWITSSGVPTLDLRQSFKDAGLDAKDVFYRTDHHWTVNGGFFATARIAEALNESCGFGIDMSLYDPERYDFTEMKDCWVGEQGNKIAVTYAGYDDFTLIEPNFETDLTLNGSQRTDFGGFIDRSLFEFDGATKSSLHYSYRSVPAVNNLVGEGNILLLSDSFSQVVTPFLSLSVHSVDPVILRSYGGDLMSLIENGNYDAVVICYSEIMIGAHDNPASSNYRMFSFDGE